MKLKILPLMAAVALFLGAVNQVSAGLLTNWASNPITVGDKTFTWLADDLPDAAPSVNINEYFGEFIVQISDTSALQGVFTLAYKVHINDPDYFFQAASLDTDVPGSLPDTKVTKQIFGDNFSTQVAQLVSLSGNPDGPVFIPGKLQTIWVRDTYRINQDDPLKNGVMISSSNTFTQATVPEPASLVIWGGLVGLGIVLRLRRKA